MVYRWQGVGKATSALKGVMKGRYGVVGRELEHRKTFHMEWILLYSDRLLLFYRCLIEGYVSLFLIIPLYFMWAMLYETDGEYERIITMLK